MHKLNIVHRDLKPENLLMTSKDEDDLDVKITDFGFASFYPQDQGGFETTLGTPLYMAPEIINKERYNKAVDIWSIGVITWILLTGKPPFKGRTPNQIHAAVKKFNWKDASQKSYLSILTDDAKDFLKKTLEPDPMLRWTSEKLLDHKWIKPESTSLQRQKTI